jgi:hypothetical protein
MKRLTVFLLLTLPFTVFSQGAFTNQTHSALQKVINDYPNHFRNIKGSLINEEPQTTDYASTVEIPGSLNTVITRYSASENREIYSWKCVLLESEDFDAVSKKYKDLYSQIKNSIIKIDGEKPFILNGTYEIPTEEKRFTTSAFYLLPATGELKKLKVELSMQYYVTEWKLALLVFDQEDEEDVVID